MKFVGLGCMTSIWLEHDADSGIFHRKFHHCLVRQLYETNILLLTQELVDKFLSTQSQQYNKLFDSGVDQDYDPKPGFFNGM